MEIRRLKQEEKGCTRTLYEEVFPEDSKGFVSKFGRAKSYGAQTIGTPDAGAVSMSYFFQGLAKA